MRPMVTSALPIAIDNFPSLRSGPLSRHRIYLDNACLTPTPVKVIEAVQDFYRHPPGCPLRSESEGSGHLEQRIRDARDSVRQFLNAKFSDEIVFTPNTTFSINLVAGAFQDVSGKVLISDLEHNSNRLPWLRQERVELAWPPGSPFPFDAYRSQLSHEVKLVSVTAMSNVTGAGVPVREIVREAHALGIPVHFDAAQAFTFRTIDVTEDLPDFVSFSFHKAYGPSGLGGLYLRRDWQLRLRPSFAGAGTVDDHFEQATTWTHGAARFEYGLQNYAAQYAIPATIAFLSAIPRADVEYHFALLNSVLRDALKTIPGLHIVGPAAPEPAQHICSFYVEGTDSMRLAALLDMAGKIQVRAGKLCAHHWFHRYKVPDVLRVSFGIQNSVEEVEEFGRVLDSIRKHYV